MWNSDKGRVIGKHVDILSSNMWDPNSHNHKPYQFFEMKIESHKNIIEKTTKKT